MLRAFSIASPRILVLTILALEGFLKKNSGCGSVSWRCSSGWMFKLGSGCGGGCDVGFLRIEGWDGGLCMETSLYDRWSLRVDFRFLVVFDIEVETFLGGGWKIVWGWLYHVWLNGLLISAFLQVSSH